MSAEPSKIHMTIVRQDDHYTLRSGYPSELGLTPTAVYVYEKDDRTAVIWTIDCNPPEDELIAIAHLDGWHRSQV